MSRFEGQPVYVLHARPYRESSLLLDVFSRDQGRCSILAKGVRGPKSMAKSLLQPFIPLYMACSTKTDLWLLNSVEPRGSAAFLKGRFLWCALYMNELCVRLLPRWDPHSLLFDHYEQAIVALAGSESEEKILRLFEKTLLKTLGYALPLTHELESGAAVRADAHYHFDPSLGPRLKGTVGLALEPTMPYRSASGFVGHSRIEGQRGGPLVQGRTLLALATEDLEDQTVLRELKGLMRQVLAFYLGSRPLETRQCF